jgi:O-methyltransferase
MKSDKNRDLYINLLKKSLINFFHIDCENSHYANAMPLEWVLPEPENKDLSLIQRSTLKLKVFCRALLINIFRKFGLFITRSDGLTDPQRLDKRLLGHDWPPYATTMIGLKRLDNLQLIIEAIIKEKVDGDFVETGVWRGGASIFMRGMLIAHGITDRSIWACDSFEGIPKPEPDKYPEDKGDNLYSYNILAVSLENVKANFKKYDLLDNSVYFIKGYFKDTLSGLPVDRLSLLRLDGDLYESTQDSLTALYHKLSLRGFVIIDDYGLPPCRSAVHDFRDANGVDEKIIDIEGGAAYWQKLK